MVERNRYLSVLTHAVLILGVAVICFPLYLTFVASTHTTQEIVQVPMPLTPGRISWTTTAQRSPARTLAPG